MNSKCGECGWEMMDIGRKTCSACDADWEYSKRRHQEAVDYQWSLRAQREMERKERATIRALRPPSEIEDSEYDEGYADGRNGMPKNERKYELYSNYRDGYADGEGDRAYE